MATATIHRLDIPVLPERKGKHFLARLADALGGLKLAKENLEKSYDDARAQAIAAGIESFHGERFEVMLTPVESLRLDQEKLEAFLKAEGYTLKEFQKKSESVRLTVKPIL